MLFGLLLGSQVAYVDIEVGCALEVANDSLLLYIYNNGTVSSGGFYIDVFVDHPYEPVVGQDLSSHYIWVSSVPPGDRIGLEIQIPGINDWQGGWLDVMSDSTSLLGESDEGNNVSSAEIACCFVHGHWF